MRTSLAQPSASAALASASHCPSADPKPRVAKRTQQLGLNLALALLLSACSQAPEPPRLNPAIAQVHSQSVDAMTRLVAQREWLNLQQASRQSALSAPVQSCVARFLPDDLATPIAPVLHSRFAEADRAAANAFLSSPAGQHLSTALLNTLHGDTQAMDAMQAALPAELLHAQVQFTQTKLGLLLIGGLDPRTRADMQAALQPLLQSCQEPALA